MATVFDVSADIAMFRRPYTTTSSVSYPLPTPTAVAGLLAAILGFENGSGEIGGNAAFWPQLAGTRIGFRLLNKVKWRWETINFWNLKNPAKSPHIQVKHQFLSQPSYRIFVQGPVEERLNDLLVRGEFVFTPYLGVAYAIADIKYQGQFPWDVVTDETFELSTVVPFLDDIEVDIRFSEEVFREKMPFKLGKERSLSKTIPLLYQADPNRKLRLTKRGGLVVTRCGDELVAWFPEW